jgi:hypothetical protein
MQELDFTFEEYEVNPDAVFEKFWGFIDNFYGMNVRNQTDKVLVYDIIFVEDDDISNPQLTGWREGNYDGFWGGMHWLMDRKLAERLCEINYRKPKHIFNYINITSYSLLPREYCDLILTYQDFINYNKLFCNMYK